MAVGHRRQRAPRHSKPHAAKSETVSEIIGRAAYGLAQLSVYRSRGAVVSVDETRTDYAFYDLLRRGKQPGYKLGGLFAKRLEHIFAVWEMGRGVTITLAEPGNPDAESDPRNYTDERLADFLENEHAQLMTVKEDTLGLGDQYIFVNPDGTLSVPSPDIVEETRDPLDYRTVLKVTITTKLPSVTILDEYRPDGRTVTYKQLVDGKEQVKVKQYANLIGRIAYVHLTHGMSQNECYGHSIHEDLLKLYDQYDDVIHKQLDGAKLLGNPILAFVGMEDLSAVIDANKPVSDETYIDFNGNEITRPMLNVDANSVMLIGKGGDGKFISPPVGFTADTNTALNSLFELLQFRTGAPEFLWGAELSSARATSDTQLEQWARDIEGTQKSNERWLIELCDIWLALLALTDPQIVAEELKAEWPSVLDANQDMRLKMLQYASTENLLQAKTKLELTGLPVDDLQAEIDGGAAEAQTRAADQQAQAIDLAQATKPPANGKAVGVAQMEGDGYNGDGAAAVVAGAMRIIAGEHYGE